VLYLLKFLNLTTLHCIYCDTSGMVSDSMYLYMAYCVLLGVIKKLYSTSKKWSNCSINRVWVACRSDAQASTTWKMSKHFSSPFYFLFIKFYFFLFSAYLKFGMKKFFLQEKETLKMCKPTTFVIKCNGSNITVIIFDDKRVKYVNTKWCGAC
jgi:hypothetical protein